MSVFEIVHQDRVVGKLVCFDRLVFKGYLRALYPEGAFKPSSAPRVCCSRTSPPTWPPGPRRSRPT